MDDRAKDISLDNNARKCIDFQPLLGWNDIRKPGVTLAFQCQTVSEQITISYYCASKYTP